jgi:hypothetical protein
MPEPAFASAADAAGMLDASLDHLAGVDWASLGTQAHGEMLARLQRAQARLTAVSAGVLAAFTAQSGYEPDGHKSARAWLIGKTGVSKGAAGSSVGWQRRLARHRRIAAVMAAGGISESWAREIAGWTDKLPADKRDEADQILLDAAAGGLPLEDIAVLARTIHETWKAQHPDPDDGDDGDDGDEDGFGDRFLRLGSTFGGVGKVDGDLTAACTAALQAVFGSLGKHLGPDDHRTIEQRQHDALAEALQRLIRAGLLPESAGQATLAQVHIDFADLRRWHDSSALEEEWVNIHAGQPGWLTGPGAEAEACDARVAPVVTGSVDWQALDQMTQVWLDAHHLGHREPCGCTCGGCTCPPLTPLTPEQKTQLRAALLALAADAMSGPDGLAAYLRTRQLGAPYSGKSLPLDMGTVKGIPEHLRRAVILRDQHCAWPGGCDRPPAGCQVHHVVYRSRGGKTRLKDLILLCHYHHQVCIHRLGWTLTLNPDGTTEARSPDGEIIRSHSPPTTRAG